MNKRHIRLAPLLSALLLASCITTRDLAHDPFPKAQAELPGVFNAMIEDVIAGDVEGLRAGHLNSDKFTKFGGKAFERMNVDECNKGEAAGLASVRNLELEYKDLKIDVFGKTAIMTCY